MVTPMYNSPRDIGLFAHQNLTDLQPLDFLSKEFSGQLFQLINVYGHFDAAGQAASAYKGLGLENNRGTPISSAIRTASSTDSATPRLGTGIFMLSKISAPSYSWSLIADPVPFKHFHVYFFSL